MTDQDELNPEMLLRAYCQGYFPMATGRAGDIRWFSPDPRGIIPLANFHVPRNLAKRVRQGRFRITFNQAFEAVVQACAEPRSYADETWISPQIVRAYTDLHDVGLAHSVEAWAMADDSSSGEGAQLVGGLYGVSLNAAFFGESMFSRATDASKVCLVHLVNHMQARGMTLLDIQFPNDHLSQFGACAVAREDFLQMLERALSADTSWC